MATTDTAAQKLQDSFDSLSKSVLRVKAQRDALLVACQRAYAMLDDRYDVEQFTDGSAKEQPFNGAGQMMNFLKAAIDKAVA